jgi:hypothetical protein
MAGLAGSPISMANVGGSASATKIGGCADIYGANYYGGNISLLAEFIPHLFRYSKIIKYFNK